MPSKTKPPVSSICPLSWKPPSAPHNLHRQVRLRGDEQSSLQEHAATLVTMIVYRLHCWVSPNMSASKMFPEVAEVLRAMAGNQEVDWRVPTTPDRCCLESKPSSFSPNLANCRFHFNWDLPAEYFVTGLDHRLHNHLLDALDFVHGHLQHQLVVHWHQHHRRNIFRQQCDGASQDVGS